ncbi:MAG: AAA family ATPase [Oligoflexia bacterium]|nr:AAA family ATPase [Oligoflexia bacterium]
MAAKHPLYLHTLNLHNWATFHHQEIKFDKRFNAIVGETGSGKSLIINAIEIILGARADKKLIRKDAPFATVEAIFYCEDLYVKKYLDQLGFPTDSNNINEIIIKRIIYANAPTKSYLNYSSVNSETLINFSNRFIDFVGQFENQKLLQTSYQLKLLDQYGDLTLHRKKFQEDFETQKNLKKELQNLKQISNEKNQRMDYLHFQLNEINYLNPSVEDEDNLLKRKIFLSNLEKQVETIKKILNLISESDIDVDNSTSGHGRANYPALTLVKKAASLCEQNSDLALENGNVLSLLSLLSSAQENLNEVSFILNKELGSNMDISSAQSEQELQEILERLDLYQKIKAKHGPTIENVLKFKKTIEDEMTQFESIEDQINNLANKINSNEKALFEVALDLHNKRKKVAVSLSKILTSEIHLLKMEEATIDIVVDMITEKNQNQHQNQNQQPILNEYGLSEIKFLVETNPGEGYHILKDIISGGELSRILLALRQTLSTKDLISIFLFDEIDAGIGGETAINIGKALFKVAQNSQVIAITHLPQVAHSADKLIVVSKDYEMDNSTTLKRTLSLIKEVSGIKKDKEIKSMLILE